MYVCWENKKNETVGKHYKKFGNAIYKMFQLYMQDTPGLHLDFEPEVEQFIHNGKPINVWELWHLSNHNGKWFMTCAGEGQGVIEFEVTDTIKYFEQHRMRETA